MSSSTNQRSDNRRLRVLVVDDSVDATDMLTVLLEHRNCEIQSANTGAEAIEVFERQRPDLVLLDLGLPDMDGRAVAERLRATDHPARLVALSGFAADSVQAGAPGLFSLHMLKPIDLTRLEAVLEDLRS